MAGVAAGIVTEAQLYSQPANQSKMSMSLMQPGTWAFIWVGAAMAYLIAVYVGAIRISGTGE